MKPLEVGDRVRCDSDPAGRVRVIRELLTTSDGRRRARTAYDLPGQGKVEQYVDVGRLEHTPEQQTLL